MVAPDDEAPHGDLVDGWPWRAWLGIAVEAVTGLCYLLGLLGLLAEAIGGRAVSAQVGTTPMLLLIGGTSWEALAGGLLIAFRPRAMAGTRLEFLAFVWGVTSRRAGLILAPGGAFWAAITILLWATVDRGLRWQRAPDFLLVGTVVTGVPFLMMALGIPPIGGRRRGWQRH